MINYPPNKNNCILFIVLLFIQKLFAIFNLIKKNNLLSSAVFVGQTYKMTFFRDSIKHLLKLTSIINLYIESNVSICL